ncbi:AbgT family transporter [Paenarthrobacter sp. NPDC090522]|uniref:AbgT family transporter n=1 Tax=Paenarthrobacter sp. NPDC090522 TaxID=3364383 RepID=UPI0037F7D9D6
MSTAEVTSTESRSMRFALKAFDAIERVGNKIPNPFWLFCILALVVIILSAILQGAGISAINPASGDLVQVRSLLSKEGLEIIVGKAVSNFAQFPPMATIVVVLLGIAIAQRSGLIDNLLHRLVARVPGKYLTFAVAMAGMVSHVADDAAYMTLIPIGALVFKAAGRSPVLGIVVTYVSISAGYDASPVITVTDVLLSGITTAAAQTLDPAYVVTPLSNYFFSLGSSILIALVITVIVETLISRRPELQADAASDALDGKDAARMVPSAREKKALRITGIVGLASAVLLTLAVLPVNSPLRGEGGSIVNSVLFSGMAFIIGLLFAVLGATYGFVSGNFTKASDVIAGMIEGTKTLAPILVLFFAISQFLAYFKWTKLGEVLAISGAEWLGHINAPGWAILLGIAVLITFMNFIITSGSGLWALAAPVFVPMLMLLDINPETTQAIYRVADSVTNCVTPMSPYFIMALGFIQQYRKDAGIGTLASYTIPISAVIWVVWVGFFMLWYALGVPLGPGVPSS